MSDRHEQRGPAGRRASAFKASLSGRKWPRTSSVSTHRTTSSNRRTIMLTSLGLPLRSTFQRAFSRQRSSQLSSAGSGLATHGAGLRASSSKPTALSSCASMMEN
jgi:hypothetical protein